MILRTTLTKFAFKGIHIHKSNLFRTESKRMMNTRFMVVTLGGAGRALMVGDRRGRCGQVAVKVLVFTLKGHSQMLMTSD